MSGVLPPGWALTDIGTLGRYINGRGFGKAEWKRSGVPIIRIQNLNDESATFNYSDQEHEEKYRVRDGDLLVAWAASLGVYVWKRGPAWLNQHIFRVEVEERVVTKSFLHYTLKHALAGLYKKAHGSGMVHVTKAKFDNHPVSLPPINEQKRIVSKIDELFSRIDEGERALERVSKLIERYRQSVLRDAVTGELTRDWRERNKDKLETGQALLVYILKTHREAWEQTELGIMKAKGIKPTNDSWKQKYTEPGDAATDFLGELPDGWQRVRIDAVGHVQLGRQRSPAHHSGDHMRPYLRVANVYEERIDVTDVMEMNFTPDEYKIYALQRGDILLNEGQSKELVGRPAMYMDELPGACFTNTLVRFRATSALLPQFALIVFLHYMKSGYFRKVSKITTNIAHLGAGRFAEMSFPVPSLSEQREIVERIEEQSSSQAHLKSELGEQGKRVISLRQSVLKSAFSGALIPHDPTDEPAAALLKRIVGEPVLSKTAAPKPGRKKKYA